MIPGKLRYRTTDGALHLHRVTALEGEAWAFEVHPDATLPRLAVGSIVHDVELMFSDSSAPKHRKEAAIVSREPKADGAILVELG